MQLHTEKRSFAPNIGSGVIGAAPASTPDTWIDPVTLANLDFGLFKALLKLGTSKGRICSALCLSYEEYDYISRLIQTPL